MRKWIQNSGQNVTTDSRAWGNYLTFRTALYIK